MQQTPPDRPGVAGDFGFAARLVQHLVVPTFVLDAQGRVIIWNRACEQLTGVSAESVLGTCEHWRAFYQEPRPCLADLVAEQRLEEITALYAEHNTSPGFHNGVRAENWCVMPQRGQELYLAIDVGPIYDDQGTLIAVVETLRDKTSEHQASTELERLAHRDGLSGLANRRHFDMCLNTEWVRHRREQRPLSLLMVDVDHFKRYNDLYGHVAGDVCLQQVAQVLAGAVLRPCDVVARYGGEEFALILPAADAHGAETVVDRIQGRIAELNLPHAKGEQGRVTLSLGVATRQPGAADTAQDLLKLADEALYEAKGAGRNRCIFKN